MEIESVIQKAQEGNKEAFTWLIRTCQNSLYRLAKSILANEEDCGDAIQEAIFHAYQNIGKLQKPKFFQTWISRILIHECYQILRQKKKVVTLPVQRERGKVDTSYERVEFQEVLKELDESTRLLIHLYYYEDLSIRQIAEMLDIPEGTVKSRLYQARKLLSKKLGDSPKEVSQQ